MRLPEEGAGLTHRSQTLERLEAGGFDLLVIGGGITGAGIALDASTRGLQVALIEKNDFASGTSSRSSKLIHGGLRYLEHRDFGLMREAARERDLLRRVAPNLVTPIPFFWPEWAGGGRKAASGLWAYDILAAFRNVKRHRRVDSHEAAVLAPGTRRAGSGYIFYDSQTDDARMTLAVLDAARRAGAVICNYVEAFDLLDMAGRVAGCSARNTLDGAELDIRAGEVVNATGIWADEICTLEEQLTSPRLRPSKGIHILVSRKTLPLDAAVLIPTPDRKLIFACPWRSSIIVGTTDTAYSGSVDAPVVSSDESEYLLATLSKNFDKEFKESDVVGAYAGLRPLLADARREQTRDLSRRHAIFRGPRGLLTITGGKFTTYRAMAEEVVDLITRREGRFTRCITTTIRLGVSDLAHLSEAVRSRCAVMGMPPEVAASLVLSYGDRAPAVLDLAEQMELTQPVSEGLPYLQAELVWAARTEMAGTVADLLSRRTRLGVEDQMAGTDKIDLLAPLVAPELGISESDFVSQAEGHLTGVMRERGSSAAGLPKVQL